MAHLDYTNDLRRKAGETNDASELTDNLVDVQTRGRALDHVNVTRWSLDYDNVFDEGGIADELRQVYNGFVATFAIAASNTWTGHANLDFTVDCNSLVSGVYIYGQGLTDAGTVGDFHDIAIFLNGSASPTWFPRKGEGNRHGDGLVYAFEATAGSHQIELKFRINVGHPLNVTKATLIVFVVNR
jgi:hypothetical protein